MARTYHHEIKASEMRVGHVMRYCGASYHVTKADEFDAHGLALFTSIKIVQGGVVSNNFTFVRHYDDSVIVSAATQPRRS